MSTEAEAVASVAIASAGPSAITAGEVSAVVVPEGFQRLVVDAEWLSPAPRRVRGTASLVEPESLVEWVGSIGTTSDTALLYADEAGQRVTAVLNDGDGWCDLRGLLQLTLTREWKAWREKDGALEQQRTFADFLEDHIAVIVEPDAAVLIEMVETIQGIQTAKFRSSITRKDGTKRLAYDETVEHSAGRTGELSVPDSILLQMPIYEGGEAVLIGARIRLRVNAGNLVIGFVLDRPGSILRDAFRAIATTVATRTGLPLLYGSPRTIPT